MTAKTSHPQHDTANPESLARRERGLKVARSVGGKAAQAIIDSLANISPALARRIMAFGFGDAYSCPGLDPHNRQLVMIGVLTALGGYEPQLRIHIGAALNVGLTCEKIVEAILYVSTYAGFPRALNVTFVACEVFAERDAID